MSQFDRGVDTYWPPARTAEEERADVLAFLVHALTYPVPWLGAARPPDYIDTLRGLIESGAHVGAVKREQKRKGKT